MSKSKKIIKDSTESKEQPKNVFDEYLNLRTLKQQVTTNDWAQRVAAEMLNWVENDPEAFKMNEFFRRHGIDRNDIIRLQDKYPILKRAHQYCLTIIGDKREKGAAHVGSRKLWDPAVIMPSLGRFDPDLREFMEWKAKMAAEIAQPPQNVNITVNDGKLQNN
jgi:hypothetical protein